MNKYKYFLGLIAFLLIVLVPATGCATTPAELTVKPTITSFAASPAAISQGQQTTLSWNVSGATEINIQPDIGTQGASGSLTLTPSATVTYTLTATNPVGSATSSATITVTPVVAGKPDLVITQVFLEGSTIYFKVKNVGTADAKQSWATLYINGIKQEDAIIDALAVGQELTELFSKYSWVWFYGESKEGLVIPPVNVKICVNNVKPIDESNTANNCVTQEWGQTYTYDFKLNAPLALWRSSNEEELTYGVIIPDPNGSVYMYLRDLTICVPQESNGWIMGRYADFYLEETYHLAMTREIKVPENAKFTAQIGFKPGVTSSDGVKVALGYLNEQFSLVLFPKMDVQSDGKLHPYEVDLSSLKDKNTEFFIWVEANGSPEGDCVQWIDPKIIQE